jgi:hypothetical protein
MPNSPDEETDEPLIANDRNYYKVEKWTKDGSKVLFQFALLLVIPGALVVLLVALLGTRR